MNDKILETYANLDSDPVPADSAVSDIVKIVRYIWLTV